MKSPIAPLVIAAVLLASTGLSASIIVASLFDLRKSDELALPVPSHQLAPISTPETDHAAYQEEVRAAVCKTKHGIPVRSFSNSVICIDENSVLILDGRK